MTNITILSYPSSFKSLFGGQTLKVQPKLFFFARVQNLIQDFKFSNLQILQLEYLNTEGQMKKKNTSENVTLQIDT